MRKSIAVAVGVGAAILVAGVMVSAADNMVGTWKLNVAKSKFDPAPGPKGNTFQIEAAGDGIKVTTDGVDAEGKPTHTTYSAKYDGKDNPVTGNPNADMISYKKIDDHTYQATSKKAGKVTTTSKIVISADGKTRTTTTTGTDTQGRKVNSTLVYDRQ